MAVPLATGSLGYAPTNEGGLADVFQGTTTDALEDEKLKRLLAQQQMFQATAPQRQAIGQEVYNDPSLAGNKQLMAQLQRLYSGSGIAPPITPYKPAQPGGVGQMSAVPDQPGATASGLSVTGAASDPMAGTQGDQGTEGTQASGGIKWQDLYNPDPNSTLAKLGEARDKRIEDTFSKQLLPAMKSGNADAVRAIVHSSMAQARAAGWTPEQIEETFEPYLAAGVAALSPMEVAKIANTQEKTSELGQMIGARLQEVQSQTALNNERVQHLRDIQSNFLKLLGPKQSLMAAQTKQALDNAAQLIERGDMEQQEGEWYGKRTTEIAAQKGTNPQEWDAAVGAISRAMDNSQTTIRGLQASIIQFNASIVSADPQTRARAKDAIDAINAQIVQEQSRYNAYTEQYNELMQSGNFSQPGMQFGLPQQPLGQQTQQSAPGTYQPPAEPTSGGKQPAVGKYGASTTRDGKTYYYWPSDGKYHTSKPQG